MRSARGLSPKAKRAGWSCAFGVCLLAHAYGTKPLQAQAWIPVKGEGAISLTYQDYDVDGHYDAKGNKSNNASTHTQVAITEVDYGITDAIGVSVTLPVVASKYTGPPVYFVAGIETHPGPLDDGSYHAAFQDLRVEVRRLFWAGAIPVAPFVAGTLPTHNYEIRGEAVPGRHRRDFQIGADTGMDLDQWLPGSYVHVRYGYARAQKLEGFPFNRSNIDLEVGYAVGSRLVVRGLTNWQIRHQGPAAIELAEDWEHHDRFISPAFTNLGMGVSLPIGQADVYAAYVGTARGSNGAHQARTIAVGVTFGFGSSGLSGLGGTSESLHGATPPSQRRFSRP